MFNPEEANHYENEDNNNADQQSTIWDATDLVTCGNCNRQWDGCAQCDCWKYLNYAEVNEDTSASEAVASASEAVASASEAVAVASEAAQIASEAEAVAAQSASEAVASAAAHLNKPDILIINLPRIYIQGGLSNEEYGKIDYRLLHIFPTSYTKKWKHCKDVGADSKFTDIQQADFKAEGKRIEKKNYVDLTPSRDTGADRNFNRENFDSALALNQAYYFYEAEFIDEHIIKITVYWCPINIVKTVYETHGNGKGKINQVKKNLIAPYFTDITPTIWNS
jgi:hypothetical protein